VSITKYLKSEFEYENASHIKLALKKGVANGTLTQKGQSFVVTKDSPKEMPAEGEPLQIEDVQEGTGDEKAEVGDTVNVEYVGRFEDKTIFDSAKSFEFLLGAGDVIKGKRKHLKLYICLFVLEYSHVTIRVGSRSDRNGHQRQTKVGGA
jgi:FKBP-type peptidyl-prolyl cis-trans isomerase